MAKIPFDIKYRSQIESGEYRVVCCEQEYPVTILMWNFKDPDGYNILGYYEDKKGQHPLMYDNNGQLYHDKRGIFDLSIITPGPELSEFEQEVSDIVEYCKKNGRFVGEGYAKRHAKALLSLARKELENETPSIIEARSFKRGVEYGKAEALKDLPRWRHAFTTCLEGKGRPKNPEYPYYAPDDKAFIVILENSNEAKCILLDDLKKLPGFKEDDNHE